MRKRALFAVLGDADRKRSKETVAERVDTTEPVSFKAAQKDRYSLSDHTEIVVTLEKAQSSSRKGTLNEWEANFCSSLAANALKFNSITEKQYRQLEKIAVKLGVIKSFPMPVMGSKNVSSPVKAAVAWPPAIKPTHMISESKLERVFRNMKNMTLGSRISYAFQNSYPLFLTHEEIQKEDLYPRLKQFGYVTTHTLRSLVEKHPIQVFQRNKFQCTDDEALLRILKRVCIV